MKQFCLPAVLLVTVGTTIANADQAIDFAKQIQPIFNQHCTKCHGAEKAQGKLRLHTAEAIQEKLASKPNLLVAGDPQKSELYERLVLPESDSKRMPKKADPLSKDQLELIAKWIEAGAVLNAAATASAAASASEPALPEAPAAPKQAIDRLTAAGATVMPLGAGSTLLAVSFAQSDHDVGDADIALLADVAEQVDTLNLAGCKATSAGLAPLSKLKNLSRLHLEKSSVTDDGLSHLAELNRLHYLNLYGTGITDAGLSHLHHLKHLQKLYLWQAKVSFDAAMALEKAIPGLSVDIGFDHPMVVKMRLTKELEIAKAQASETTAEVAKLEKQLENAKKNGEAAAARLADIEKQIKTLEADSGEKSKPTDQEAKK